MIYFASKKIPLKHLEKSCQKCKKKIFFSSLNFFKSILKFPSNNYLLSICMPKNMKIYKNKMSYKQKKIVYIDETAVVKYLKTETKQTTYFGFWLEKFTHKKTHTSLFCNKIGIKSALLLVIFFHVILVKASQKTRFW